MKEKKIAVREFVEFLLTRGDIDNRLRSPHTASEGAKLHRKIQKQMTKKEENYEKEVSFRYPLRLNGEEWRLEGRADGVYQRAGQWVIQEIKTSGIAPEDLPESQWELFRAQGALYAWMLIKEKNLSAVDVEVLYFETLNETTTSRLTHFTKAELDQWVDSLAAEYTNWLVYQEEWQKKARQSFEKLKFPYPVYRAGQYEMAKTVYKTIAAEGELFIEAPTGIGKTISTLFPSIKALGSDLAERIFYLTAKTVTQRQVEEAITQMRASGLHLKNVTLTAKDKVCFLEKRECTPEACPFAKGYYDRLHEHLLPILQEAEHFDRQTIEGFARKYSLCPFELALDISSHCELIIGDYNYVYDPLVYLRRFFEETKTAQNILLVDEAHNLLERGRGMFSAALSTCSLARMKRDLKKLETTKRLSKVRRALNAVLKEINRPEISLKEPWHQKEAWPTLDGKILKLGEALHLWLPEQDKVAEQLLEAYFEVLHYSLIQEFYNSGYETILQTDESGERIVTQFCIDPSALLDQRNKAAKAAIFFSATLSPLAFFKETLGGELAEKAYTYRLPSPFPPENLQVLRADLPVTYREREATLPELVDRLAAFADEKKGNYLFFFPSYRYLELAAQAFKAKYPAFACHLQEPAMNDADREAFLAQLQPHPDQATAAFCVLGGLFSEGIDLKGERLSGVAIVTVGLPQFSFEKRLIHDYYEEKNGKGYAYAYQLPGLERVLQAAGRLIRSEKDVGGVLLIDSRFGRGPYPALLPPNWQVQRAGNAKDIARRMQTFWKQRREVAK
ncbi:helicase C-terminal domain-containing protein [Enterococcus hirae]|nr:helicase C-terminal domain-containing protein [Enterococcus hirae]